jgi:hypothetical protein
VRILSKEGSKKAPAGAGAFHVPESPQPVSRSAAMQNANTFLFMSFSPFQS